METKLKKKKKSKAGRKEVADKKRQMCIYIEGSFLDKVGGIDAAKEIAVNAIKSEANGKETT